jgi:hypothetical protein
MTGGALLVVVGVQGGAVKTGKGLVDAKQPPYVCPHSSIVSTHIV